MASIKKDCKSISIAETFEKVVVILKIQRRFDYMYRNFICYRGGSSGGIQFAEELFSFLNTERTILGETYYSLAKNDRREIRNFLTDPKKCLATLKTLLCF